MHKRNLLRALAAALAAQGLGLASTAAFAADPIKIGLILPMTGQQASTGRQIDAAVKLYMAQNNPVINGRKVEIVL
jgi:branched-chain amino acid transport system substrate-binding protein